MLISFTHLLATVLWATADERRNIADLDTCHECVEDVSLGKKSFLPAKMNFTTPFSVMTLWQERKANQSPCGSCDTMNSCLTVLFERRHGRCRQTTSLAVSWITDT